MLRAGLYAWGVALALAGQTLAVQPQGDPSACAADFFRQQVQPILVGRCLECHGEAPQAGLDLRSQSAALRGGESGAALTLGDSSASRLYDYVAAGTMPPTTPLSTSEVSTLKQWIDSGAYYPAEQLDLFAITSERRAGRDWWSLKPLTKLPPPSVPAAPAAWQAGEIDRFVWAKLTDRGLTPSPPADPRVLIRRVTFDLIGLPPTPEEVNDFVAACATETGDEHDVGEEAYVQLVDRLLASAHYGEQWGRHWLDVVRFGESNGYERNVIHNSVWPFRDYVIRSLNEDKPFDRFIVEQLAGDVLAPSDPQVAIGTAFLVCGPYDNVGNQDAAAAAQIRADAIDEIIRASTEAFIGLTVGCSRCHDHKFDPVRQRDYYALYATFAGVRHGERKLTSAEDAPNLWVGNYDQVNGPFHVFVGGSPQRLGAEVQPASLSAFAEMPERYELAADSPEPERRMKLAQWIVSADNPLTPRVLANRLWHYHFGVGIVDTPSDFGFLGGRPTHPELLDWLAGQLLESGWRLKPLHRRIVLSQTYRQSSASRADAAKVDADGRLLWRFPPQRLTAEQIRDTMLSVSGKLDTQMGGPGFRLFEYVEDNVATYHPLDRHGPETYRRAVYHHNARALQIDLLSEFDAPDCAFATPRRSRTTTPLQSLTLMNHRFTLDMAQALAERVTVEANSVDGQITRAFELAFGRVPDADELAASRELMAAHGLATFCRGLFNTNEFVYVD